jgi:serine/threonine-protein kinase
MAVINAGDVIAGKYRVERVLGEGGMGFVVAATHLTLETPVAIKFIRDGVLGTREASVRFLREAKAAVQLKNPHVAQVYDVGTLESGEPFMVMEYLEGCDLSDLFKQRGALPPAEVCEYVVQACDALGEAHALGIVHRDVKLGNLFLTRGAAGVPIVKVLDFGLSKASPFGGGETGVTMSAAVLGSPRFMSPEQLQDPRTVDGRTDIWSLGIILYTLLAGRPAFDAETVGKLFAKVMGENPRPLEELAPRLDPGLIAVVNACLQKSPDARISNVADLASALSPYCMNPGRAQATAGRLAAVLAASRDANVVALAPGSPKARQPSMPPASTSGRSTSRELGSAWAQGPAVSQSAPKEGISRVWLGLGVGLVVIGVAVGGFYVSRSNAPTGNADVEPIGSGAAAAAQPVGASATNPTAVVPAMGVVATSPTLVATGATAKAGGTSPATPAVGTAPRATSGSAGGASTSPGSTGTSAAAAPTTEPKKPASPTSTGKGKPSTSPDIPSTRD